MSAPVLPNSTRKKLADHETKQRRQAEVAQAHADYIRARERRRAVLLEARADGLTLQSLADAMDVVPETVRCLLKVPPRNLDFLEGLAVR